VVARESSSNSLRRRRQHAICRRHAQSSGSQGNKGANHQFRMIPTVIELNRRFLSSSLRVMPDSPGIAFNLLVIAKRPLSSPGAECSAYQDANAKQGALDVIRFMSRAPAVKGRFSKATLYCVWTNPRAGCSLCSLILFVFFLYCSLNAAVNRKGFTPLAGPCGQVAEYLLFDLRFVACAKSPRSLLSCSTLPPLLAPAGDYAKELDRRN